MGILENFNKKLAKCLISDFDNTDNKMVRTRYGIVAGWAGIIASIVLFALKMGIGLLSGSVSVIADAFHLLSHLANSVILVVSFIVTARPATSKNPFGHGRMEHVAPLVMSIFLFVSGIQIGEKSLHQVFEPHEYHYWSTLIWILLLTILVKQWLAQFITFLGKRVDSHAIIANAAHQNIEAVITFTVIGGLISGHKFHYPAIDGYIGVLVSAWLLYLGYTHGKEAIVPLLGQAPSKDILKKIRETAKSVEGVDDIHEIIVHDYGSMYLISFHAEISENHGHAEMHEISENCERKLREVFGGEAVCHMDPVLKKSPEIQKIEDQFKELLKNFPKIQNYHDFRIVAASPEKMIIVADIDLVNDIPDEEINQIKKNLSSLVIAEIPNIAYCSFYITPKFAY
ncbi:MAG: cation transporter [Candidatus Kuenenia sp.]|nr:cation transporter [Candidatus Kuenenia hertensis]